MSITQNLIDRNINGEFPKQKSCEWYDIRQNMITASEISSVLDCNIYQTSYDLLVKKISPIEHISNDAMVWGNIFEPIAIKFYEFVTKEIVHPIGLVSHSKYKWIGASPDGILLKGKLLEIKCPIRRNVGGEIPLYYWIQMQIQMEVCDIDECDYFECEFYQYSNKKEYDNDIKNADDKDKVINNTNIIYYKLTNCSLKTVLRNKDWFQSNIIKLKSFYDNMLYYKNLNNGLKQLLIDSKQCQKRKRSDSENLNTKSNCVNGFIHWGNWVSATKIKNYMIDDPLIDWLKMYHTNINKSNNDMYFQQYVMKQGIKFEEKIISNLKQKYPNDIVTVASYQEAKSYDKYLETVNLMKKGVPIIYQGVLHDYTCKIFGMPDLLVRRDWINKIFGIPAVKSTKKSKQYRVIEIKFISLELCSNGKHLCNSNKNILAYKGQLYIYNKILGNIQGNKPTKSYILGKSWSFQKCKETFSGDSFERCAHVNFKNNDKFIRSKTARAIKWIRDLNTNGKDWEIYSRNELKPNMCNVDQRWVSVKNQISEKHNDVTSLWMCGIKNRDIADDNGVKNWKTHKGLTSEKLGVFGNKTASILQLIIDINQCPTIHENKEKWLIEPKKVKNNLYNWKKPIKKEKINMEFYVDFETITSEICNYDCSSAFIFMIGVGINFDGVWSFKCFISENLTSESEKKMLIDFHQYITSFAGTRKLWHWGSAENYLYRNAMNTHSDILKDYIYLSEWCDMLRIFKEEPIVARGMMNFSLKSVVKAFYDNKFIKTTYDICDVNNGLTAMMLAYETYTTIKHNDKIMKDIETYNEVDCKVLLEIISYLRKNHI
jgi:putative phage-type endonuclease